MRPGITKTLIEQLDMALELDLMTRDSLRYIQRNHDCTEHQNRDPGVVTDGWICLICGNEFEDEEDLA